MATSDAHDETASTQPTEPLDVDGVSAMIAGTLAWLIGLLVLLATGTRFSSDNGWWLWACLAGAVFGGVGIAYTRRRRAVYRSAAAQHAAT